MFTSAAAAALQSGRITHALKLELKTNITGSDTWQEVSYEAGSLKIHKALGVASALSVNLINAGQVFSNERSAANRAQIFGQARVTAYLGAESEVVFDGRTEHTEPADLSFGLTAYCWRKVLEERECDIDAAPSELEAVDETTKRELAEVDSVSLPGVYGLTPDGSGTDPAFAELDQTVRRSWAPSNLRVYKWDADASDYVEVPGAHWEADWVSGVVQIVDRDEGVSTAPYWVSSVRVYLESAATGADDADVATAVVKPALLAANIDAGDIDCSAVGIDLGRAYKFKGSVADLILDVQEKFGYNLVCQYDCARQKFWFGVVTQQALVSADFTLYNARSVAQPRGIEGIYSEIVAEGFNLAPPNALIDAAVTNLQTGAYWTGWNGFEAEPDSDFETVAKLMFDGDATRGALVHNLPPSEGGGTNKYDSWYGITEYDFHAVDTLQRFRCVLPGGRNPLSAMIPDAEDVWFWPGVLILVSEDGTTWLPLAPAVDKARYRPHHKLDLGADQLARPRFRYARLVCGAFKHGFENQSDPGAGMAELEFYFEERYEEIVAIQDTNPAGVLTFSDGSTWSNYHPDLLARLGGVHRRKRIDYGSRYPRAVARDAAIQELAESVRLFQQVGWDSIGECRVAPGKTCAVADAINSPSAAFGILAEEVEINEEGSVVSGMNYLADPLDN